MTNEKARLIQLVHIGKSQLEMDEESYRVLLSQQFYQNSSKDVSVDNLRKLVKLLQSKGAKIRLPFQRSQPKTLSALARKLWSVWKSMADSSIISSGTSQNLDTYVQRLLPKVKHWNELNNDELIFVLESLKQWNKRVGR